MRRVLACVLMLVAIAGLARPAGAAGERTRFDHRTTGFELLGRHRDLPCEACHVNAVFRGTPRACVACHGAGTAVRATAKPPSHIRTTDHCEACHTPVAWVPAVNFDHTQTLGSCSSCHNNVQAQGKDAQHIATGLECNACHDTLGWAGAQFDHAGITGGCASCHNGVAAVGMPANHIPTAGAPCEDCHLPTQFTTFGGAAMDHVVVASLPCSTCHEAGLSFAGTPPVTTRPPPPHPATGECSTCHTTANWDATDLPANHIPLPAADAGNCALCHSNQSDFSVYAMNHVNISSNCAQCHAAGLSFANMAPPTLKELPANHIPVGGAACEDCHSPAQFTNFDGATMDHAVVASTPCTTCHEAGLSFAGTPPVTTRPPPPHPATGECSNCHTTANWNATDLPANHIPLPAADAGNCALCHANPSDYSVAVMNHANISSNCAQCHAAGLSFANMAPPTLKELPSNHIPVGGAACEDCHSPTQFTSFDGATMDHAVVASTPCTTCHEAGLSFAGTPAVTTRPPPPHPATGECSNCHTTANWDATGLPANHIPLPAADAGNCALCHANPSDYSVAVMNHVNISTNCAQCHGAGLSFANMAPPTLKEPPVGPPPHVPIGSLACELCHVATNFTSFAGTVMRHAAVTGQACDSCHELGMAWYGEPNLWVRPSADHHAGQDCGNSGCHRPQDKRMLRPASATPGATVPARGVPRTTGTVASPGTVRPAAQQLAGRSAALAARVDMPALARRSAVAGLLLSRGASPQPMSRALGSLAVDHSQLTGACVSCHNGGVASGPPPGHLGAASGCDSCHTTNAWLPARFDHLAVAPGTCASCHDGVRAIGKPRDHVQTVASCDTCHGTLAWRPVRVDHSGFVSGCAGCHNNVAAVGLTVTHLRTARDCSECHRYPDWGVITFRHATAAFPGAHHAALGCIACHTTNTEQVPYADAAAAGRCGGCHARDFKPAAHPMTEKGLLYSATDLADCAGACHIYSDATRTKIIKSLPGPQHRVSDATF